MNISDKTDSEEGSKSFSSIFRKLLQLIFCSGVWDLLDPTRIRISFNRMLLPIALSLISARTNNPLNCLTFGLLPLLL